MPKSLLITFTFIVALSTIQAQSMPCNWLDKNHLLEALNEGLAHPTVATAAFEEHFSICPDAKIYERAIIEELQRVMDSHLDSAVTRFASWEGIAAPWACVEPIVWQNAPWSVLRRGREFGYDLRPSVASFPSIAYLRKDRLFEWAEDFGYGLALVQQEKKHAFIDHSGHAYPAAFSVEAIQPETEAVFLSAYLPIPRSPITTAAPNVKVLCMDVEWLTMITLSPELFPNLEVLILRGLKTDRVAEKMPSAAIPIFPNLQRLVLAYLKPSNLDKALAGMPHLKSIALERIALEALPSELGGLHELEELWIEHSALRQLPTRFGDLQQLRRLSLTGCKLKEFPEQILGLDGLQALDLSDNGLATVPRRISNMKGLQTLQLRGCQFEELPRALFTLPALEVLDVSENDLNWLPLGLPTMPSLRMLDLHGCFNAEFKTNPKRFPNLCWLSVASSRNGLAFKSLTQFTQLHVLDLSDSKLEELPAELRNMKGLQALILKKNHCCDTHDEYVPLRRQVAEWLPGCKLYFE
jgi:Leucine-rich repeat (LRR) protein